PGLKRALKESDDPKPKAGWLSRLEDMAAPFVKLLRRRRLPIAELLRAHLAFAEALAASDEETGGARLWRGEAGDASVRFLQELTEAASGAPPVAGARYPMLLDSLMVGRVVRPRYGAHPRLSVWGPLEARLQQVEVMVLGGLNEGTWPAASDPGPWLSRPMRAAFGLPPPERRIGQAAHDFAQAMTAPEIFLTRAHRVEGTPTVPSRWLLRLEALLAGLGHGELLRPQAASEVAWAEALDRPAQMSPMAPPEPRPPLAARPRQLSVTEIETWLRNPYALYARKILKLRALDPLDADPGAADRGTLVHRALEAFVKAYPRALPDDVAAALIALGEKVFAPLQARPGAYAFWWPRFQRAAAWIAEAERRRRSDAAQVIAEARGTLTFGSNGGDFTVTAKADRIERLRDGTLAILDYKTGTLPKTFDIEVGRAAQLPLEAAIAEAGGFAGVEAAEVSSLLHWRLTGGDPPGEEKALPAVPEAEPQVALAGLKRLVSRFDSDATPYRPAPYLRFDPYAQLARVKEWTGEGES
ncbi:MAG: double-strand break repair protein AddB, partial [Kiloniellales bacterium]